MIQRQVKPINEGAARPPRGKMTWIGVGAILLFAVALIALTVRPMLTPEREPDRVRWDETGPPAAAPQTSDQRLR